jgi:hypothetical protein
MEMKKRKRRYLQIALVLIGCVFLLLYPLMQLVAIRLGLVAKTT